MGHSRDFSPEIPPGALPTFDLSTVTYVNLFGTVLNVEGCLIISNDVLLGLFGTWAQSSNAFPNESALPISSSSTPLPAEFDSPVMQDNSPRLSTTHAHSRASFSYPDSPKAPVASSSRQTLTDIQPGQGEQNSTAGMLRQLSTTRWT
jgi:hypothetical protein